MPQFFLCYVETTRRCNRACPYCMSRLPGPAPGPEMSGDEIRRLVLDELAEAYPGSAVAFSGGETLLREDALDLVSHAAGRGLWVFLNTNGRALTAETLPRLREAANGHLIAVLPMNSVDPEEQRWTRDDGADTVLRAADRCREAGVEHFFLVTVSRRTAASLAHTMEYLKRRQTPVLRAPFVPRGAGAAFRELMLTREDMERSVHPALAANHLSYISFTPFFASPEALSEAWRGGRLSAPSPKTLAAGNGIRIAGLGCQAGRSFAAVSAEGEITPCVQLLDSGVSCGNVRTSRLSEVLARHEVFEALRSRENLGGRCGRCRYKFTCGGCRALSHYSGGGLFGEDPTCFFEPEDETTRSPLEERETRNTGRFLEFLKYNEPWNTLF